MFQPYERCVGISTDSNWKDITSAPRDGTPIELENCYGIRPTYSLCKWIQGQGWIHVNDECHGVGDGPWLRWREYKGDPSAYVDPTNGAQETMSYWQ